MAIEKLLKILNLENMVKFNYLWILKILKAIKFSTTKINAIKCLNPLLNKKNVKRGFKDEILNVLVFEKEKAEARAILFN